MRWSGIFEGQGLASAWPSTRISYTTYTRPCWQGREGRFLLEYRQAEISGLGKPIRHLSEVETASTRQKGYLLAAGPADAEVRRCIGRGTTTESFSFALIWNVQCLLSRRFIENFKRDFDGLPYVVGGSTADSGSDVHVPRVSSKRAAQEEYARAACDVLSQHRPQPHSLPSFRGYPMLECRWYSWPEVCLTGWRRRSAGTLQDAGRSPTEDRAYSWR